MIASNDNYIKRNVRRKTKQKFNESLFPYKIKFN